MGVVPWPGEYEVGHEGPGIKMMGAAGAEGTRLRVSFYHPVITSTGSVMICPSEPETVALLRDQAQRVHKLFGAKQYFMGHDEIRCMNWDEACEARHLSAGEILADNVRTCVKILREAAPGGTIYVWSDMFDPNHNAHQDYYLVHGDLAKSWEGVDKDVVIALWYLEKREASMKFFAGRGNRMIIAGYYDAPVENMGKWLEAAGGQAAGAVVGTVYTTWGHNYKDLEGFEGVVDRYRKWSMTNGQWSRREELSWGGHFHYNRGMNERVPALVAAMCLTVYWAWVVVKLVRMARHIGKDANAMPRERVGQLMRVVWYPCILALLVGLWVMARRGGGGTVSGHRGIGVSGWVGPLWELSGWWWWVVGPASLLCVAGTVVTFVCWRKMGRSWRIGIDPKEKLELVSTGPYRYVRHPIYAIRMVINICAFVMAPSLLVLVTAGVDFVLLQVEARREEKYMESKHGAVYGDYKKSVGRFVPRAFVG
jgi:protein-S-isoprenylcysteine O-methyltransferase Ste14